MHFKSLFLGSLVTLVTGVASSNPARGGEPSPASPEPRYAGPLFDAMAQTDQTLDGEAAVAAARAAGVTRMALFARVHRRQDGRSLVARLAAAHPDFIVCGSPKYFEMRRDLDKSVVSAALEGAKAGRYRFIGEILYTHGDKAGGEETATGERYIDPLQPNSARLVAGLSGLGVPILTHWETYEWNRDWPRFDKYYGDHPDQVFVWPHAGFGTAEQLDQVLRAHPNVWATLSKKEKVGANLSDDDKEEAIGPPLIDEAGRILPDWKAVLLRFHDRLLFATDAHKPERWAHYGRVVQQWRAILAQLPADDARAIGFGNAARLYGR
jgi:hypothetical protein